MQRRRMNALRPRKYGTFNRLIRFDRSLAPSLEKLRLPGRLFYPVNTFSLAKLLCFLCHIGKGKARAATIMIDSRAHVE